MAVLVPKGSFYRRTSYNLTIKEPYVRCELLYNTEFLDPVKYTITQFIDKILV